MELSHADYNKVVSLLETTLDMFNWQLGTHPSIDKGYRNINKALGVLKSYTDEDSVVSTTEILEAEYLSEQLDLFGQVEEND